MAEYQWIVERTVPDEITLALTYSFAAALEKVNYDCSARGLPGVSFDPLPVADEPSAFVINSGDVSYTISRIGARREARR